MQIGFFGGAEHHPLPPSWPNSPSALAPGDARKAWDAGLEEYLLADELGFDFVTTAEHHYSAWIDPNPVVTSAVLSQQLRKARLCLLGATLPMLNPVRVAEELALLDVLANGRLTVGLLRGTPNEVMTYYNVNPAESRAKFQEGVELVRACWNEPEAFAWEGRYYRFRTIAVWPRPATPGGPRLLLSGSNRVAATYAARQHADLGLSYGDVPDSAERIAIYREAAEEAGWTPDSSNVLYRNVCYVAETDEQAAADATEHQFGSVQRLFMPGTVQAGKALTEAVTGSFQGAPPSALKMMSGEYQLPLFCGSPETVIAQLKEYRDIGVGKIDLTFGGIGLPRDLARRNLELFAAEVLPAVHAFEDVALEASA